MNSYDLAVIGSGPAGYVAALYASRRGFKVCVIEKSDVGGTCLNAGCIPTKSLLDSVSIISKIKTAQSRGIDVGGYSVDIARMMARKEEVVKRLRAGIETLFRANKIDLVRGCATIVGPDTVKVSGHDDIKAKYLLISTGSMVSGVPGIVIDNDIVLSSESALNIKRIPKSIAIIGGGVIGCEFASFFNKISAKVTVVEMADRLVSGQSREASKKLESVLKRNGVDVITSAEVEGIDRGDMVNLRLKTGGRVAAEMVLVSVGRRPDVDGLGLELLGIGTDGGRIRVDDTLRTSVPSIFAAGDCVAGPQLAHKASYDAMLAVDNMIGETRMTDYSNIPSCIWTDPEIASVGLTEEAAKSAYSDTKVAKFPYMASGKAYLEGESEGFVKLVGRSSGEILGVEIFGKDACNLIGEAVLARSLGVNIKDWSHVVHGHPTLSEMIQEACHSFRGTPIHSA